MKIPKKPAARDGAPARAAGGFIFAEGALPPAPMIESVFMEILSSIKSSFDVLRLALLEPKAFPKLDLPGNIGATYFICRNEFGTVEQLLKKSDDGEYAINGASMNPRHRALRGVIDHFLSQLLEDDVFRKRCDDGKDLRAILFVQRIQAFLTAYHLVFNDCTERNERRRVLMDYLADSQDQDFCDRLALKNFKRKERGHNDSKKGKAVRGTASV